MVDTALIICVYIAWVLIFFLLFTCPAVGICLSFTAAFFWALIIGLIFILIWYFAINRNNLTSKQKTAMNVILIVAIVLPLLVLIWWFIMWVACRPKCKTECDPCPPKCPEPCPKPKCPEPCPPKPKCAPKCPPRDPCDDGYGHEGWEEEGWERPRSVKSDVTCSRSTGDCVVDRAKVKYGNNVTRVNFQP